MRLPLSLCVRGQHILSLGALLCTTFSIPFGAGKLLWYALAAAFSIPMLLHWIHISLMKIASLEQCTHSTRTHTLTVAQAQALATWVYLNTIWCIHTELREFNTRSSSNAIGIAITLLSHALFVTLFFNLILPNVPLAPPIFWCEFCVFAYKQCKNPFRNICRSSAHNLTYTWHTQRWLIPLAFIFTCEREWKHAQTHHTHEHTGVHHI